MVSLCLRESYNKDAYSYHNIQTPPGHIALAGKYAVARRKANSFDIFFISIYLPGNRLCRMHIDLISK